MVLKRKREITCVVDRYSTLKRKYFVAEETRMNVCRDRQGASAERCLRMQIPKAVVEFTGLGRDEKRMH